MGNRRKKKYCVLVAVSLKKIRYQSCLVMFFGIFLIATVIATNKFYSGRELSTLSIAEFVLFFGLAYCGLVLILLSLYKIYISVRVPKGIKYLWSVINVQLDSDYKGGDLLVLKIPEETEKKLSADQLVDAISEFREKGYAVIFP